jgi:hypothetical protein
MNEIIKIHGWTLTKTEGADEPLVPDTEIAAKLGYKRPGNIRKLITRMVNAGQLDRCSTVEHRPENGGRAVEAYLLTEQQALKVIARSETQVADKILDEVIAVYMAWRKGQLPAPAPATPALDASQVQQIIAATAAATAQAMAPMIKALAESLRPAPALPPASPRHLQGVAPSTAQPVQRELLPDRHRWYTVEEISRRCCASYQEVWDTYRRAGYRNPERRQSRRGSRLVWEIREDAARYIAAQLGGGR